MRVFSDEVRCRAKVVPICKVLNAEEMCVNWYKNGCCHHSTAKATTKIKGCKFENYHLLFISFERKLITIFFCLLCADADATMNYLTEGGVAHQTVNLRHGGGCEDEMVDVTLLHIRHEINFISFCRALRTFNTLRC